MSNEPARANAFLDGARIAISGSLPGGLNDNARKGILEFVRGFAATVFRRRGHIIHGAHPQLTPVLLEEAQRFHASGGRGDCLSLVVSRTWSKFQSAEQKAEWRRGALLYEIPEVSGPNAVKESLTALREWLAGRCDALALAMLSKLVFNCRPIAV